MRKLALTTSLLLLASLTPAPAQYDRSGINALNDIARSQAIQADSMRRQESMQRDSFRRSEERRHNAERDSRSMRRFDR